MVLSEITSGTAQEYRVHRATSRKNEKTGEFIQPTRSTMHKEIVTLRLVLKTAHRHGWLPFVPDLSPPYKTSGKITHRAWFSPTEYRQLYKATRQRAKKPLKERWRRECEQMHDYVLFMANTGLRPDEAKRLQYRDVSIVRDAGTGETILEIEVRGKRGVGYCKSTVGAVRPFNRLRKRNNPQPTDYVFPGNHVRLFNAILDDKKLKFDREGNRRTAYSLRHTYICLRLMEGADIYQIAKNCRTSVEMIEKHYAVHLKNTLDAAAINVRKPRPPRKRAKPIPS
jgi:integrase